MAPRSHSTVRSQEFVPLLASDDPSYKLRWRVVAAILVLLPLVLFVAALHTTLGALWYPETWNRIAEAVSESLTQSDAFDQWFNLGLFLVALPCAVFAIKLSNRRVIKISEDRISMTGAPWDRLFGQDLNWTLRWSELSDAWLEKPSLSGGAAFLVLLGREKRRINLVQWIPSGFRWPPGRGLLDPMGQLMPPWHKEPDSSPLVQQVIDAGVTVDPFPKPRHFGQSQFDLMSDKSSKLLTCLMVGLMVYGGLDLMFGSEQYVGHRPVYLLAAIAAVAALTGWLFGRNGAAPASVTLLLALLLGLSAGFAAYPGLLRVNAVLDPKGKQNIEYRRVADSHFAATQGGWPDLTFPDPAYWAQLEGNVVRTISIRRGGLGIVQVDFRSVYPEIHAYYDTD